MKQEDYRKMCDKIKLSDTEKEQLFTAAKTKAQLKKNNRMKLPLKAHTLFKFALATVAVMLLLAAVMVPSVMKQRNGGQPAAQVEKSSEEAETLSSSEEKNSTDEEVTDFEEIPTSYYLLLGLDTRTDTTKGARADAILLLGMNVNRKTIQVVSIPSEMKLNGKEAVDYNWKDQGTNGLRYAIEKEFDIKIDGQAAATFSGFAQIVNLVGGLELTVTEADLDPAYARLNGYLTEVVASTGIPTKGQITKTGTQLLDGPQVVAWCRVKDTEAGVRGQRFLTVFEQLGKKLIKQTGKPDFLMQTWAILASDLEIDWSFSDFYTTEAGLLLFDDPQITYLDLADNEGRLSPFAE